MKKIKKYKIIYESMWESATPEQRKELQERLDRAYDFLFSKVLERYVMDKQGEMNGKNG
mgnify:CR=1 FL=1